MLSDVEEKTFEFGMLRALGFNTRNIMITIIMQSFTFSVPGLLSGLLAAAILNLIARKILYLIVQNESTYNLSSGSLWIGITLGLVLPLLSNIIPIQRALGKNLRASLDQYRRSLSDMAVQIKSLQKYGLSLNQFFMGLGLLILGILTYYVAPQAFLFRKFEIFFGIMNLLLILMILGLTWQ